MEQTKCAEEVNTVSSSGVDDDDVDLGGDEGAKELDGNIDEDELLKDTEVEESNKNDAENEALGKKLDDANPDKVLSDEAVKTAGDKIELSSNEEVPETQIEKENNDNVEETTENISNKNDSENEAPGKNLDANPKEVLSDEVVKTVGDMAEQSGNMEDPESQTEQKQTTIVDQATDNMTLPDQEDHENVGNNTSSNKEIDDVQIQKDKVAEESSKGKENSKDEPEHLNTSPIQSENKAISSGSSTNIPDDKVDDNNDDSCGEVSTEVEKEKEYVDKSNLENEKKLTGDSEDSKDGNQNDQEESSERTKFVHVDDENSRPDESLEPMDTGEDPFAQTVDEPIISDKSFEKSEEFQKEASENEGSKEAMDTEETISVTDIDKEESDPSSEETTIPGIDKENIPSDVNMDCSESENTDSQSKSTNEVTTVGDVDCSNSKDLDSQVPDSMEKDNNELSQDKEPEISKSPDLSQTSKESNDTKSSDTPLCDKEKNATESLPSTESEVSISKESKDDNKVTEANKENDSSDPPPDKGGKSPAKGKPKSKKKVSDESSDDESDLEIIAKPSERPKRDAAKKAESQIKEVLSATENDKLEEKMTVETGSGTDSNDVEEVPVDESDTQTCASCKKVTSCTVNVLTYGKMNYFCDEKCFNKFREGPVIRPEEDSVALTPATPLIKVAVKPPTDLPPIDRSGFVRKCSQCSAVVNDDDEKTLSWETMDFCSEDCLGKYQQELGSFCAHCKGNVQPASLGKYCVRFGYEVKQFCCSGCLEEFKKGLKVCSFCQKDISSGAEGFLAPVGDKGTFKDFCTQACMEKYEQMSSNNPPPPQKQACDVCAVVKTVDVEVFFDNKVNKLCSDICFTAYKFANKLKVDRCDMCKKYFDKDAAGEKFNIFYENVPHNFCCKTCMNVYILAKRKIVPCYWCKVKKYNFDMIKRVQSSGQTLMACSLNCLTLYQVSVNAVSSRRIKCDMCLSVAQAQYHLTMSDATIRNFCTYPCVMNFQQQYTKSPITLPGGNQPPIPTGAPKRAVHKADGSTCTVSLSHQLANGPSVKGSGKPCITTRLYEPPTCLNKKIQARPAYSTKSVSCRPHLNSVEVQTDEAKGSPVIVPIPFPIFVPSPMAMYSLPYPVPFPVAIPVPVPVFLPTTRNSIKGIMKEFKRIQEKTPSDPFEAELLMMADMVAGDKKQEQDSSDSEPDAEAASPAAPSRPNSDDEGDFSPAGNENSNTFGEVGEVDIMQMALKMATELDEPANDLETHLTPSTILSQSETKTEAGSSDAENSKAKSLNQSRKRSLPKSYKKGSEAKRKKSINHEEDEESVDDPSPAVEEEEKPDANMKLKYTFGVNAWKSWVTQKNTEIEKLSATNKKIKPFNTDILKLTVDELNLSLCLFVKEVKKPNGSDYAPDTIFYLCLGIQQYLFENGRIDNIFTDSYFETFTDTLDEMAKKFTTLFNDQNFIVTRVEEEHLWESKQLGAHSPHVLLSTLMFFNTKHFHLTNSEEHLMLSFSHIMKHWKRGSAAGGVSSLPGKASGSRNVLLRFYPPQNVLDDPTKKKKKVYEQHENEENPLRCPVKLYEFYMSKCPDSVKSRNDVFYLQPERSCVPDSPVWYSTSALGKEPLDKMLNRVKMVKEINIALLNIAS